SVMSPITVAITILGYIIVLLLAAYYSSRRAKNSDFFVAGRSLTWQIAAMSMVAAAMSGITFVSVPGSVAADSFSYLQMVLGFTAGQFVIAFVLIPIFYKLKVVSLYEYLESRFGEVSHKTGAWFFFVSKVTIAALRLYVMCAAFQVMLFDHIYVPFEVNVALVVGVIWLATRRGGVKSLVWTDILKTFCLVGSLVLTIFFIVRSLGWSGAELMSNVAESSYSRIFFFDDVTSPKYFWKMFLAGLFTLVAMTGLDQDMMQCNLSCVNYRHAQKNIVVTAFCQLVVISLFLILGVLLYEYAAAVGITTPAKSDNLFSLVATHEGLPAVVGVLFIVGLTASTFASSASSLTALTTSCTVDLVGVFTASKSEEQIEGIRKVVHSLIAVAIAVLIAVVGSFSNQAILNLLFKFVGYTYGPILGLFAFGILTKYKVRDSKVWIVAVASLIISVVGEFVVMELLGYKIGFELLIYNALITFAGLMLLRRG
ncbi:MAG: sodium:solute symporter, partial [Rikenellaceae bacterium]